MVAVATSFLKRKKKWSKWTKKLRPKLDKLIGFKAKVEPFKIDFSKKTSKTEYDKLDSYQDKDGNTVRVFDTPTPAPADPQPSKECGAFFKTAVSAAAEIDSLLKNSLNEYYNALNDIKAAKSEINMLQYSYFDILYSMPLLEDRFLYYQSMPIVGPAFVNFVDNLNKVKQQALNGQQELQEFWDKLSAIEEGKVYTAVQDNLDSFSVKLANTQSFLTDDVKFQMMMDAKCPSDYQKELCKKSKRELTVLTARMRRQLARGLKVATQIVKPINLLLEDWRATLMSPEFTSVKDFFFLDLPSVSGQMEQLSYKRVDVQVDEIAVQNVTECRSVDIPFDHKMCDGKKKLRICECEGANCCFEKEFHYSYTCGTKYMKKEQCGVISCPYVKQVTYSYTIADLAGGIPLPEYVQKELVDSMLNVLPSKKSINLDFGLPELPKVPRALNRKMSRLRRKIPKPEFPFLNNDFSVFPKSCTDVKKKKLSFIQKKGWSGPFNSIKK